MILMCVVVPMCENDVRLNQLLCFLKPPLYFVALERKETVSKLHYLYTGLRHASEEVMCRLTRFILPWTYTAENTPQNIQLVPLCDPRKQGAANTNLYVISMGPKA